MDTPSVPDPPLPSPDPQTRSRRLGRQVVSQYPRLIATAWAIGHGVRIVLLVALVLFAVGAVSAVIGVGLEYFQKSGWTWGTVGLVILGLLFALLEWIGAWPGYVWILLIAAVIALKIISQLEHLTLRIGRLERRMVKLTKAVKKEDGGDFDGEDEW